MERVNAHVSKSRVRSIAASFIVAAITAACGSQRTEQPTEPPLEAEILALPINLGQACYGPPRNNSPLTNPNAPTFFAGCAQLSGNRAWVDAYCFPCTNGGVWPSNDQTE